MLRTWTTLLVVLAAGGMLLAAGWPQFHGPDRNSVVPGAKLARSWPEGGPRELWKVRMAPGYGGAAVEDGKVYVLDRQGRARDVLRCLSLADGSELWTYAYDAPGKLGYDGPRSTPTIDTKYLFVVGPFGHFHCLDKATHKVVWKRHLLEDFGGKRPTWGVAQSAALYGDTVIVNPLGRQAGVVAMVKDTGEVVWKSPAVGRMEYASPLVTRIGGVDQVLAVTSRGKIVSVEIGTGKVLWSYSGWRCNIPIPTPSPIGDGRIFITGGYRGGSVMIKVARGGDGWKVDTLWRLDDIGSILHDGILYKGHIYANFNTKRTFDGLACVGLDGKIRWKTGRKPNFEKGGILVADGVILTMGGQTGTLAMVEATPEAYRPLAEAKVLSARPIWAPLALADGKLLCRDQRQLKCLQLPTR